MDKDRDDMRLKDLRLRMIKLRDKQMVRYSDPFYGKVKPFGVTIANTVIGMIESSIPKQL